MTEATTDTLDTLSQTAFSQALAAFQAEIPHIGKSNTAQVKSDKGNYCLDPATRVLRHDLSWVPLGKLCVGDEIVAFDEEPNPRLRCRRYKRAVVEKAGPTRLPAYRITLLDGTTLIASTTHRWLTRRLGNQSLRWMDTQDLKPGVTLLVRGLDVWDTDESRSAGYLAGAFDGEGNLCQTPVLGRPASFQLHCSFAQRDNAMLAEVDALLASAGFGVQHTSGSGTNRNVHHLRIAGGRSEVMRLLGSVRPKRLLALFDADRLGTLYTKAAVGIAEMEYLGDWDLVAIQTSTRTLFAEGIASHNSYTYADLSDITLTALPLLAKHGLSWTCKTMMAPAGFLLLSSLRHRDGWVETAEWPLPDPTRSSAQQVGSALTYARRYCFTALTGVAPGGEDDDAQAAAYRPAADTRPDPVEAAKSAVWKQAQRLGWDMEALRARYAEEHQGQVIDDAPAADLHTFAKALAKLGANGLPLNKDGSVSKRQTTEEQRAAAGMMTAEQEKAHDELVKHVTGDEKKATRTQGPAEPGPWEDVQVAEVPA